MDGGRETEVAGVAERDGPEVLQSVLKALATVADSAEALPRNKFSMKSKVTTRGTRTQPYRMEDGTWVRPLMAQKA